MRLDRRHLALPLAGLTVIAGLARASFEHEPAIEINTVHLERPVLARLTTALTNSIPSISPPAGLAVGSEGPRVRQLQTRLRELRYDISEVDGQFASSTFHAVMAFQKTVGLPRTGRATSEVFSALERATEPPPMVRGGEPDRVEVDIQRQVLFLFRAGHLNRILSVSTGDGTLYCVDGHCDTAVTPVGSFRITRRIKGVRESRLGKLWNPLYFDGGIAIHGSPSVPASPASHGCVRISMASSEWFFAEVLDGTPVYVLGAA